MKDSNETFNFKVFAADDCDLYILNSLLLQLLLTSFKLY